MASLRATYGIDLRNPGVSVQDLAELTLWLPPGCPLWLSVGGPLAVSLEQRALHTVEFRIRVLDWHQHGSKGAAPKPIPDPPYAAEKSAKTAAMRRKEAAYYRRQERRRGGADV